MLRPVIFFLGLTFMVKRKTKLALVFPSPSRSNTRVHIFASLTFVPLDTEVKECNNELEELRYPPSSAIFLLPAEFSFCGRRISSRCWGLLPPSQHVIWSTGGAVTVLHL
jgi:hypothetical protein